MGWLDQLINFLYPSRCLLCSRVSGKGEVICFSCREGFVSGLADSRGSMRAFTEYNYIEDLYALGPYRGDFRRLLQAYKYKDKRELSEFFASLLAEGLKEYINDGKWLKPQGLIPVPLHPRRFEERGFNQSELLAEKLSTNLEIPVWKALKRVKYTQTQTRLSRGERIINLQDAFQLELDSEGVRGSSYIMIDDICTSGATLNEAARIFKEGYPGVIYAAVLAH
ncbi:MAG: ComF family protein [Candidatus Syntrophonatronum acetioxidans]|uniref:ComF family protein n=1 Tax=Candidatus Syntrophonatronum acetioxidans TaxID=1795816 RepID=A0A424YF73_9FIRM|nr:MAG: ComF family protein [Candidatus Syntrophonatronum acetioxidans]